MKHPFYLILLILAFAGCRKHNGKQALSLGDPDKMMVKRIENQSSDDFKIDVNNDSEYDLLISFHDCLICNGELTHSEISCLNSEISLECFTSADTVFAGTMARDFIFMGQRIKDTIQVESCQRRSPQDKVKKTNKNVRHLFFRKENEVLTRSDVFVSGNFIFNEQPEWAVFRDQSGFTTSLGYYILADCHKQPADCPFIGFKFTEGDRIRFGWIKIDDNRVTETAIEKITKAEKLKSN
jgi:hypothetical protein